MAHHELRVGVRRQELAQLLFAGVDVDPLDVGTRRHDRRHALIAELEHALDDVLFGDADRAGFGALADERLDLVLGEVRFRLALDAKQPEHDVGGRGQQPDDRAADARQHHHRPRHPRGDGFRIVEADALRHQLAEDQRQHGDAGDDDAERDAVGVRRERGHLRDRLGERLGQPRAAVGAGQHADQRDAELHRGEELVGIVRERERRLRALVALFRALLQAHLARGHDGDLRHGEHAVGEDEQEDDDRAR